MIVVDPTGRTPEELAGVGGNGLLARRPPINVTLIGRSQNAQQLGPVDAGVTDLDMYFHLDVSQHPSARIVGDPKVLGSAGSKLQLQFNPGSGWVNAWGLDPIELAIDTAPTIRPLIGLTKGLSVACTGDMPFRLVGIGGDGATLPEFYELQVQFIDVGRRRTVCNSAISTGADVYEDFCAYATIDDFANAYGYARTGNDPLVDYWELTGDGYRSFDGTNYALYLEHLGRHWLDQVKLIQTPFRGGHKAHVIDMPAGTVARGSQGSRWPSEWQIEGATTIVTPRTEVTVKFNLETMDDLDHIGSQFELIHLRFLWAGTGTAAMRLLVLNSNGTPRLYAQRSTTPSGGSGPLNDLGPASDVLGAGDLKCSIVGTIDEGVGVDFDIYLYGAGAGGIHSPIYSESVAGLYDRFQTARMLEAFCLTPAGQVDGAFKLTTYELDLVNGSIIGGL